MDIIKQTFIYIRKLVKFTSKKIFLNSKINIYGWNLNKLNSNSNEYCAIDQQLKREYNKHRFWGKQQLLCYAPFKNLYFQPNGQIIACCFNRIHLLGEQSDNILNVWKGERITKLRNYIINDDLSLGCSLCHRQMRSANFEGVSPIFYDEFDSNPYSPVKLEFELENTCNLECIMCNGYFSSSIRKNRDKLPPLPKVYDDKFVESLDKIIPNLKRAKFMGGEPFLISIYYKIWERIIELNPKCIIDVQTNGTILTERVKGLLGKGNFWIGVSLDSINKETYENIRLNANFETVFANVKYFADYASHKGNSISISVCPMRINWREIPDIISWCNQLRADVYFNTVYYPLNNSLWNLPSPELKTIQSWLNSKSISGRGMTALKNKKRFKGLIDQINSWYIEAILREEREKEYKALNSRQLEERIISKLKSYILSDKTYGDIGLFEGLAAKFSAIIDQLESEIIKSDILIMVDNLPVEEIFPALNEKSFEEITILMSEYLKGKSEIDDKGVLCYD